jgi:hypothetical protein
LFGGVKAAAQPVPIRTTAVIPIEIYQTRVYLPDIAARGTVAASPAVQGFREYRW